MHLMSRAERAKTVAFLPQQCEVPADLTARQLVLLGRYPHRGYRFFDSQEDHRIAADAMRTTDALPLADRAVGTLSAGERQRVHLAAAVAQQPKLLMLDEPTSALDPYYQLTVFEMLKGLCRDGVEGVVVVTHDLNLAGRYADTVLLLRDGHAAAAGGPSDVLQPETLRSVYGVAFDTFESTTDGFGRVFPVWGDVSQPSAVGRQPSAGGAGARTSHQPSERIGQPFESPTSKEVGHPPSAISRQPSAVSQETSAVSHQRADALPSGSPLNRRPFTVSRFVTHVGIAVVALCIVVTVSPGVGSGEMGVLEAWQSRADTDSAAYFVAFRLRLAQTIKAVVAGLTLSLAGAVFQTLFRNVLATPYTLGIASGGSLGALIAVKLGLDGLMLGLPQSAWCAMAGCAVVVGMVFVMASGQRLAGNVTIGFFCSAMMMFVTYLADVRETFFVVRWMMGSLESVGNEQVLRALAPLATSWGVLLWCSQPLTQFALGDELAASRGVRPARLQMVCIVFASLGTARCIGCRFPCRGSLRWAGSTRFPARSWSPGWGCGRGRVTACRS